MKIFAFIIVLSCLFIGCSDGGGGNNNNNDNNNDDTVFVIVDSQGDGLLMIDKNGSEIRRTNVAGVDKVAFGNDVFVLHVTGVDETLTIVDEDGNILVENIAIDFVLGDITFGNGVFALVGADEDGPIFSTMDENGNFIIDKVSLGGQMEAATAVAFGDGVFAVAGRITDFNTFDDFSVINIVDPDGNEIVSDLFLGENISGLTVDIVFGNGVFIAFPTLDSIVVIDKEGNLIFHVPAAEGGLLGAGGNGAFNGELFGITSPFQFIGESQFNIVNENADILKETVLVDQDGNSSPVAFGGGVFIVTKLNENSIDILDSDGDIINENIFLNINGCNDIASNEIIEEQARKIPPSLSVLSKFRSKVGVRGVELTWSSVSEDYSHFNIWRKVKGEKEFRKVNPLEIMSTFGFNDKQFFHDQDTFPKSKSYYYKVEYVKKDGSSEYTHTIFLCSEERKLKNKEECRNLQRRKNLWKKRAIKK